MTETAGLGAAPPQGGAPGRQGLSAGAMLRQAREASGLHIGVLSVALKVPVRKLEALEADQLDQLPDGVFARALASSVCRQLKVDPVPILARLPDMRMPDLQLDSSTSDRSSLHAPRAIWSAPSLAHIPKPVLGAALALVLAAMALFFLPDMSSPASDSVQVAPQPVAAPAAVAAVDLAPPAATASPSAAPAAAPPVSQASASMPMASAAPLSLRARAAAWVEVTDAAGTVHLRKILNPGEAAAVSGNLPLTVVVGRADAMDVQVRGQAFDLVPLARDNVARFQVK